MKKDFSKPKRRTLPPSRALLATMPDGRQASATWVKTDEGWKCFSASKPLRWMRGRGLDPVGIHYSMKMEKIDWHWITPLYGPAITPPFMP